MIYELEDKTLNWVDPFDLFLCLNLVQKTGPNRILEIGVYRGGFLFSLLNNLPNFKAIAVDPFPGLDDIKVSFFENLESRNCLNRVEWYESYQNIPFLNYDLIHIDGEHSEAAVLGDLDFAIANLASGGMVVVDDIWHYQFPGIISAVFKKIHTGSIVPFMYTRNKIFLCRDKDFEHYHKSASTLLMLNGIPNSSNPKELHLGVGATYTQSNQIKGFEQILVSPMNKWQQLLILGLAKEKKTGRLLKLIKLFVPPILVSLFKRLR